MQTQLKHFILLLFHKKRTLLIIMSNLYGEYWKEQFYKNLLLFFRIFEDFSKIGVGGLNFPKEIL